MAQCFLTRESALAAMPWASSFWVADFVVSHLPRVRPWIIVGDPQMILGPDGVAYRALCFKHPQRSRALANHLGREPQVDMAAVEYVLWRFPDDFVVGPDRRRWVLPASYAG